GDQPTNEHLDDALRHGFTAFRGSLWASSGPRDGNRVLTAEKRRFANERPRDTWIRSANAPCPDPYTLRGPGQTADLARARVAADPPHKGGLDAVGVVHDSGIVIAL